MRWLYSMIEETEEKYVYGYARESDKLDGVIEYDKKKKLVTMVKPCTKDNGSDWCIKKAIDKFVICVSEESFPKNREVITG